MAKALIDRYLLSFLALTISGPASGVARYRIIEIPGFRVEAINDLGQLTGTLSGSPAVATIWECGRMTQIGSFGGGAVFPRDINNAGTVIGQAVTTTPLLEVPFIYQRGLFTALDPRFTIDSAAEDANDRGQVVGTTGGLYDFAFLWDDGVVTMLGAVEPGAESNAQDINNKGQIVGGSGTSRFPASNSHGYIWEHGKMHDLSFAPDLWSNAYEINDLGQIVGGAQFPGEIYGHPVIWDWETGKVTDLGLLPGSLSGFGVAINDHAQVVGRVAYGVDNFRTFYWENGVIMPLEDLLPPDSGWDFGFPRGINNAGQITGWGWHFGVFRSYLMDPIPSEPGDLDADGVISALDLGILLSAWSIPASAPGCAGTLTCPSDVNDDGFVNTIDLGILLAHWAQ